MKVQLLALAVALLLCSNCPTFAEGHGFPGIGEAKKWDEACVIFNQGIGFYRSGNYAKAIEKYKEAIAIYPHDYEYFNNLGLTYKKNNQFDLAAEALKDSIKLKSNSWESWSNLGSVYKHQKKTHEAIDAYTKSLTYNPPAKSKTLIQQNIAALDVEAKSAPAASETKAEGSSSASIEIAPNMGNPKVKADLEQNREMQDKLKNANDHL